MIQVCVHTVRLLHDIVRPPLNLHVGLGNVLPHYAHAEQLDAAQQENDADEGRPAVGGTLPDQFPDDDYDDRQEGKQTEYNAKHRGQRQRNGGKRNDAVNGIQKQLPEGPLGFTCDPLRILELQPFGAITRPV